MTKNGAYVNYIKAKNKLKEGSEILDKDGNKTGYYKDDDGTVLDAENNPVDESSEEYKNLFSNNNKEVTLSQESLENSSNDEESEDSSTESNGQSAEPDDKKQATKPEIQQKENDDTNIGSLDKNAKQVSHFDATENTFGEYLNKFCKNVLDHLKQGDVGKESASEGQSLASEPSKSEEPKENE